MPVILCNQISNKNLDQVKTPWPNGKALLSGGKDWEFESPRCRLRSSLITFYFCQHGLFVYLEYISTVNEPEQNNLHKYLQLCVYTGALSCLRFILPFHPRIVWFFLGVFIILTEFGFRKK